MKSQCPVVSLDRFKKKRIQKSFPWTFGDEVIMTYSTAGEYLPKILFRMNLPHHLFRVTTMKRKKRANSENLIN